MNHYYRRVTRVFRVKCGLFIIVTFAGGSFMGLGTNFALIATTMFALGCLACLIFFLDIFGKPWCCIHPYFRRQLPDPGASTMFRGTGLAEHIDELDCMLKEADIRTISSFGYEDSRANAGCDWYQSSDGIATFQAVLNIVASDERFVGVEEESQAIIRALELAQDADIEFCLHMRMCASASGQEFDLRDGSYR